jgi:hypothetical protein
LISTNNLASGDVNGVSGKDHGADRAGNREGFQETDFFLAGVAHLFAASGN